MIRISITAAAFEVIAALPFGSAVFEHDREAKGEHQIRDRLRAMRGSGVSYGDVILPRAKAVC